MRAERPAAGKAQALEQALGGTLLHADLQAQQGLARAQGLALQGLQQHFAHTAAAPARQHHQRQHFGVLVMQQQAAAGEHALLGIAQHQQTRLRAAQDLQLRGAGRTAGRAELVALGLKLFEQRPQLRLIDALALQAQALQAPTGLRMAARGGGSPARATQIWDEPRLWKFMGRASEFAATKAMRKGMAPRTGRAERALARRGMARAFLG